MDPNKKAWQADFEQEVQRVIDDLGPREGQRKDPEIPISDSVIPPARVYVDLRTANDKLRELEAEVGELRRRGEHRSRQLEEELRGRDRLKDLVVRLNQSLRILESEKNKADHLAENLTGQLAKSEAQERETRLALGESKKVEGQASADLESLKAKVDEFAVLSKLREEEQRSLQVRLQAAERSYSEQRVEWERQVRDAIQRAEESKAKDARLSAREEAREAVAANTAAERSRLEREVLALKDAVEKTRLELAAGRDAASVMTSRLEDERGERENSERALREARARLGSVEESHISRVRVLEAEREELRLRLRAAVEAVDKERALAAEEVKKLQGHESSKSEHYHNLIQELVRERENLRLQSESNIREAESAKARAASEMEKTKHLEAEARRVAEEAKADAAGEMEKARRLEAETRRLAEEAKARLQADRAEAETRLRKDREAANAELQKERGAANARLQEELTQANAKLQKELKEANAKLQKEREEAMAEVLQAKGELEAARQKQRAEAELAIERVRMIEENLRQKYEVERSCAQSDARHAIEKANLIEAEGRRALEEAQAAQLKARRGLEEARELENEGRRAFEEARELSREGRHAKERSIGLSAEGERAMEEARRMELEGRQAKEKALELDARARLDVEKAKEMVRRALEREEAAKHSLEAEKHDLEAMRKANLIDPVRNPLPVIEALPPVLPPPATRKRHSEPGSLFAAAAKTFAVTLGAVAVAVASSFFWLARGKAEPHPVPFSHATGLAWQGNDLWASDWRAEAIFRLGLTEGKLAVRERFSLPGTHLSGLAVDGESLFLCDSWAGTIERRSIAPGLPLEASWPAPGPMPTLLYHDGKYIWSADQSEGRVFRHDPASLAVLDSYPVGARLAAIAVRDNSFWTVDSAKKVIVSHRWDGDLTPSQVFSLKALDQGRSPISAFAWKDDSVWIAREGSSLILEAPWRLFKPRKE